MKRDVPDVPLEAVHRNAGLIVLVCDKTKMRALASDQLHLESPYFRTIHASECRTQEELFNAISREFQFPDYFGHNWDALEECLSDLEWLHAPAYVLAICDSDLLLPQRNDQLKSFLSVMETLAQEWEGPSPEDPEGESRRIPFWLVLHCETRQELAVLTRLARIGVLPIGIISG